MRGEDATIADIASKADELLAHPDGYDAAFEAFLERNAQEDTFVPEECAFLYNAKFDQVDIKHKSGRTYHLGTFDVIWYFAWRLIKSGEYPREDNAPIAEDYLAI